MSNYPKRVVEGKSAPLTNEIWLDTNSNPPVLKTHFNGEWVPVAGSSSDGEGDGSDSEDTSPIYFPFNRIVGYIDNSGNDKITFSYVGETCTVHYDGELIPPEGLKDYLIEQLGDKTSTEARIHPVYEYDEHLYFNDFSLDYIVKGSVTGYYYVYIDAYNGPICFEFAQGYNDYPGTWTDDSGHKYTVFVDSGD